MKISSLWVGACPLAACAIMANAAPTPKPPVKTQIHVVTQADKGKTVTLKAGETLVVRLPDAPSTGYVWSMVQIPAMPFRLTGQKIMAPPMMPKGTPPMMGRPSLREWDFAPAPKSFQQQCYLKMLQLRPFEAGVKSARLWEVKVVVATK